MKLRNILLISLTFCLVLSCTNNSKPKGERPSILRPPSLVLEKQDTVDIHILAEDFLNLFKANDLKSASQLLYHFSNDSLKAYTEEEKNEFVDALSFFHVYDAELKSLQITSKFDNEFKIAVKILPDGDLDSGKGVTIFSLNPIKYNDKWYLTVRDLRAEGIKEGNVN